MKRLTNPFSVMSRKYDLTCGQASTWKRKLKHDKYYLIEDAIDKLGEYEDNDARIGINYNIITQALLNGVYYKLNSGEIVKVNGVSLSYCVSTGYFIHFEYLNCDVCLDTKDFGVIWSLTKEELL